MTSPAVAEPPAPFLKWAGGKGELLGTLARHIPPGFNAYVDPFLGGGALFFHLYNAGVVRRAVLSDANPGLVNSYVAIRDHPDELMDRLDELQLRIKDKKYYYRFARPRFNRIRLRTGEEGDVEKAALMLYLNRTCFNGLYRVNKSGDFNTPWGQHGYPRVYGRGRLEAVSNALNDPGVVLKCRDYSAALGDVGRGDFVYLDPPYFPVAKFANFTRYTSGPFSMEEQKKVAAIFGEMVRKGAHVMLSNSPAVQHLYEGKGYQIVAMRSHRFINCVGTKRDTVKEILVLA